MKTIVVIAALLIPFVSHGIDLSPESEYIASKGYVDEVALTNLATASLSYTNYVNATSGNVQRTILTFVSNNFVRHFGDSLTGVFHNVEKITIGTVTTNMIVPDSQVNISPSDGILLGSPTYVAGSSALIGKALLFDADGNGMFVNMPNNIPSGTTYRSVSFWAYPDVPPTSRDYAFQMGHYLGVNAAMEFDFDYSSADQKYGMQIPGGGAAGPQITTNFNGRWNHIVITWQNTACRFYANGISQMADFDYLSPGLGGSTNILSVGRGFHGVIDEFAVFNRALSSNEITTIYNNGSGVQLSPTYPGLVAYYTFDSGEVSFSEKNQRFNVEGEGYFMGDVSTDGIVAQTNSLATKWYVDNATNSAVATAYNRATNFTDVAVLGATTDILNVSMRIGSNLFDTIASVDNKTNQLLLSIPAVNLSGMSNYVDAATNTVVVDSIARENALTNTVGVSTTNAAVLNAAVRDIAATNAAVLDAAARDITATNAATEDAAARDSAYLSLSGGLMSGVLFLPTNTPTTTSNKFLYFTTVEIQSTIKVLSCPISGIYGFAGIQNSYPKYTNSYPMYIEYGYSTLQLNSSNYYELHFVNSVRATNAVPNCITGTYLSVTNGIMNVLFGSEAVEEPYFPAASLYDVAVAMVGMSNYVDSGIAGLTNYADSIALGLSNYSDIGVAGLSNYADVVTLGLTNYINALTMNPTGVVFLVANATTTNPNATNDLQGAVGMCPPNGTIVVYPGYYGCASTIFLDGKSIVGIDSRKCIIEMTGVDFKTGTNATVSGLCFSNCTAQFLISQGSILDNVFFTHGYRSENFVYFEDDWAEMQHCRFESCWTDVDGNNSLVQIWSPAEASILDTQFINCTGRYAMVEFGNPDSSGNTSGKSRIQRCIFESCAAMYSTILQINNGGTIKDCSFNLCNGLVNVCVIGYGIGEGILCTSNTASEVDISVAYGRVTGSRSFSNPAQVTSGIGANRNGVFESCYSKAPAWFLSDDDSRPTGPASAYNCVFESVVIAGNRTNDPKFYSCTIGTNIHAAGKIVGVAPGADDIDAVNMNQYKLGNLYGSNFVTASGLIETNAAAATAQARIDSATNAVVRRQWYTLPIITGFSTDNLGPFVNPAFNACQWLTTVRRRVGVYYDGITNVTVNFSAVIIKSDSETTGITVFANLTSSTTNTWVYPSSSSNFIVNNTASFPTSEPWCFGIQNDAANCAAATAYVTQVRYYLEP